MYLNDNLVKQVKTYNNLSSIWDKLKYCDDIVRYYETNLYDSLNKEVCLIYWKEQRDKLNFIFYT